MRRLLLALGAIVFAAGCSSQGIYSVPLPGGADLGDNPMHLQIDFRDVLDLVPQSAVKVDGVPVGRVSDIALAPDGWTATVNVVVNDDVDLPANAHAEVAQTNLLGEKFIALSAPPDPSTERLADGAHIPVEDTRSATEIEQVLGALSLLLNGGGVAQLQPIITELNKSLQGRAPEVRSLLDNPTGSCRGSRSRWIPSPARSTASTRSATGSRRRTTRSRPSSTNSRRASPSSTSSARN